MASIEGLKTNVPKHGIYQHPKYQEMLAYGFEDTGQLDLAILVYLDLCECKKWCNVTVQPCRALEMAVICGQPGQRESVQAVLAVRADTDISMAQIQDYLGAVDILGTVKGLTLALCDADSTIVYYKITSGLVPPDPPEMIETKNIRRRKKFHHRRDRQVKYLQQHLREKEARSESELSKPAQLSSYSDFP